MEPVLGDHPNLETIDEDQDPRADEGAADVLCASAPRRMLDGEEVIDVADEEQTPQDAAPAKAAAPLKGATPAQDEQDQDPVTLQDFQLQTVERGEEPGDVRTKVAEPRTAEPGDG